jgi:macrolide-specific efflux system membrane fusion protein
MAKKRTSIWLVGGLLLAGAIGAGWYFTRGDQKAESFVTAVVERGDIEDTVSALGNIQPLQYVDVGTQVTGQLKTLHVNVGDNVKQGTLVAEIDPTLFQARVDSTKATLQNLQAQLAERAAQRTLAGQTHSRNKELYRMDAVSEEALQQSAAAEEQATAQVAAFRAQIQQTLSQLAGDEANLRYTKIYAPMTGTVVSLTARQGQTLVSSQQAPTILRVADLRTMTVWAQVSEADVAKVRVDMPVYFNTLGQIERRWAGRVRQIMPTPETVNNVVLYNVLFDVENPDQALKPQMSAQVYFLMNKAENALIVPASALQPVKAAKAKSGEPGAKPSEERKGQVPEKAEGAKAKKERAYAVRVLRDGHVEERQVGVGVMTRVSAQIVSGLNEGETVVVGVADPREKSKSRELPRPGRL